MFLFPKAYKNITKTPKYNPTTVYVVDIYQIHNIIQEIYNRYMLDTQMFVFRN